MYKVTFTPIALSGYIKFQDDKKILPKINTLLKDIARNPKSGLGKPEKLKGNFNGYYSRRIDSKHRIIYRIKEDSCEVV